MSKALLVIDNNHGYFSNESSNYYASLDYKSIVKDIADFSFRRSIDA